MTHPDVCDLTLDVHDAGLRLCERYQPSRYDALIAASALDAGCTTLMSEDYRMASATTES